MSIITLTTDWNNKSHYQGAMKGKLLSLFKSASIVDISHEIEVHNIVQAAFTLRNCLPYYPKGTVHIIDIDSASKTYKPVVILKNQHYFICSDNGLYSLIFTTPPEEVIEITRFPVTQTTFPALDVFVPSAIHLARQKPLKSLGDPVSLSKENMPLRPAIEKNTIIGHVIYIDNYGNAITNITKELFERVGQEKPFDIFIQSNRNRISKISDYYDAVENGDLVALFNISDLLEVAINKGNIAELLGLSSHSSIIVKFKE